VVEESIALERLEIEPVTHETRRIYMKSNICRTLFTLVMMGVCVLSFAEAASAQTEDWDFAARRLEGSWTVKIALVNCQTGVAVGAPFLSMLTFARGGTLLETTSNPMFFPAVRGPGHGVWSHTGHRNFKAVSVAFITSNGVLVRTQTITQKIEMGEDPNSFTTPSASVVFVPADGGPTITGCATATGTRIE
jgi:hypothetical protein